MRWGDAGRDCEISLLPKAKYIWLGGAAGRDCEISRLPKGNREGGGRLQAGIVRFPGSQREIEKGGGRAPGGVRG